MEEQQEEEEEKEEEQEEEEPLEEPLEDEEERHSNACLHRLQLQAHGVFWCPTLICWNSAADLTAIWTHHIRCGGLACTRTTCLTLLTMATRIASVIVIRAT